MVAAKARLAMDALHGTVRRAIAKGVRIAVVYRNDPN
jgi:hypothetical protein